MHSHTGLSNRHRQCLQIFVLRKHFSVINPSKGRGGWGSHTLALPPFRPLPSSGMHTGIFQKWLYFSPRHHPQARWGGPSRHPPRHITTCSPGRYTVLSSPDPSSICLPQVWPSGLLRKKIATGREENGVQCCQFPLCHFFSRVLWTREKCLRSFPLLSVQVR